MASRKEPKHPLSAENRNIQVRERRAAQKREVTGTKPMLRKNSALNQAAPKPKKGRLARILGKATEPRGPQDARRSRNARRNGAL